MKKTPLIFALLLLFPFAIQSQTLTSISPASANAGQTLDVTITGANTHFDVNGTVVGFRIYNSQGTIFDLLNTTTILSSTSLKANITIPPNAESGDFTIYVTTQQDGTMNLHPFHINGTPPPPVVGFKNNPWEIVANKTFDLIVIGQRRPYGYGTHFTDPNGTDVSFIPHYPGEVVTVHSKTILDDSTIVVNITTSANSSPQTLNVSNSLDGKLRTDFKIYDNPNGIKSIEQPRSIAIFPNPAGNRITLTNSMFSQANKPVLSIYSAEGKLILKQAVVTEKTELDISNLSEGIYMLQVQWNDKTESLKFIKE